MRLLVIEDETRIAELLVAALARAGFAVDAVGTAADAREALALTAYDAAILDLGLPDGDGLALLAQLRRRGSGVPVLVLTARDAVEDRVAGLDTGADDYLVKPFAMAELVARAKALLRRPGHALGQPAHHRVHLLLGEHEVAHDHRLVTPRGLEGEPGAERQGRLDRDPVERDLEVGAREAELVDAAGLVGARPAEGLVDPLPVGLGVRRRGEHERQDGEELAAHDVSLRCRSASAA